MENLKSLFIDSSEKQIATLGSGYLQNFISTGAVANGFCVVSDKRVYFRGKCYYKSGTYYRQTKEERTVDLKDITGTGFTSTKNILWCSSKGFEAFFIFKHSQRNYRLRAFQVI